MRNVKNKLLCFVLSVAIMLIAASTVSAKKINVDMSNFNKSEEVTPILTPGYLDVEYKDLLSPSDSSVSLSDVLFQSEEFKELLTGKYFETDWLSEDGSNISIMRLEDGSWIDDKGNPLSLEQCIELEAKLDEAVDTLNEAFAETFPQLKSFVLGGFASIVIVLVITAIFIIADLIARGLMLNDTGVNGWLILVPGYSTFLEYQQYWKQDYFWIWLGMVIFTIFMPPLGILGLFGLYIVFKMKVYEHFGKHTAFVLSKESRIPRLTYWIRRG